MDWPKNVNSFRVVEAGRLHVQAVIGNRCPTIEWWHYLLYVVFPGDQNHFLAMTNQKIVKIFIWLDEDLDEDGT